MISQAEWSAVKKEQTASTEVAKQEVASSETKPKSGYSIKTGTTALEIKSDDNHFKFRVGGRVQADGALEIAARYSYIDLNSHGLNGGRKRDLTIGLNWLANQNIMFRLNYILMPMPIQAVSEP